MQLYSSNVVQIINLSKYKSTLQTEVTKFSCKFIYVYLLMPLHPLLFIEGAFLGLWIWTSTVILSLHNREAYCPSFSCCICHLNVQNHNAWYFFSHWIQFHWIQFICMTAFDILLQQGHCSVSVAEWLTVVSYFICRKVSEEFLDVLFFFIQLG